MGNIGENKSKVSAVCKIELFTAGLNLGHPCVSTETTHYPKYIDLFLFKILLATFITGLIFVR